MPDIRLAKMYFVRGSQQDTGQVGYEVKDPPTAGWTHMLVMPGEKSSTLFSPTTFQSYRVRNSCSEIRGAIRVHDFDKDNLADRIIKNWEYWNKIGFQRDFDVAAVVLTEFGHPVPKFIPNPDTVKAEDDKPRGGKPILEAALRPVKKASKRGQVAEFFLSGDLQPLREAMARFDMTRSGVLSHLFCLNRDHGVGYELANDCARLVLPDGFDLFAEVSSSSAAPRSSEASEGSENKASEPVRRAKGKPLDAERAKSIPAPSKRADYALFFADWASIEEGMAKFDATRSALLSMLHQIHKDNGFGYDLNEDMTQAKLIVPEGFPLTVEKQPKAKKEKA